MAPKKNINPNIAASLHWAVSWLALAVSAGGCTSNVAASHPAPCSSAVATIGAPAPTSQPTPDWSWVTPDAKAGVDSPELGALLQRHWGLAMQRHPVWATTLGQRRFDHLLPDLSRATELQTRKRSRELRTELLAMDPGSLSARDSKTATLLRYFLQSRREGEVCEESLWSLNPRWNVVTQLMRLPSDHSIQTRADAASLLARFQKAPIYLNQREESLRLGLKQGLVASRTTVERLLATLERLLALPDEQWAWLKEMKLPADWPEGARTSFLLGTREAQAMARTAITKYVRFLRAELLPHARGADSEGLHALSNGAACYRAQIFGYTTLRESAEEIHNLGLSEVARLQQEMVNIGKRELGTQSFSALAKQLRTDKQLYFTSSEELKGVAESVLGKAQKKLPEYFKTLPARPCIVVPIPAYEAPNATLAYYRRAHIDGTKPGEYFLNLHAPETRPRFGLEVLTFHEAVPGHHLQLDIAQQLGDLPQFRRHFSLGAFVEGWGLYSELLASEMGLYSGPVAEVGRLNFELWRAARLVVDTGLHAKGWTRKRATDYLQMNTALSTSNIDNEVDRYIARPGQALGYKLGQLQISQLKQEARQQLGPRFDIREFHEVVLTGGSVTLPMLKQQVHTWIRSTLTEAKVQP